MLQLYGDGGGCGGESQRVFGKVNTNKDQKQKFKNSESTDERNYFDVWFVEAAFRIRNIVAR